MTRSKAQGALTEGYFAAIVASAMDAFIGIDREQRIVVFNPAAERMFLCPAADALGTPLGRFLPERFRAIHRSHVDEFLARGSTARGMGHLQVLWGLRSNGEEFPIEASIARAEVNGEPLASVIVRDVSARQHAQAEREGRLNYVIEAAAIGTWDWDIVNDRRVWSPRCKAIFGISEDEEVSYARFLELLHPDDRARTESAMQRALQGEGDYDNEHRTVWPDGTVHWVHAKGRTEFGRDGRPLRMAGIAIDVTPYKNTEEALADSEERLRLAQQVARVGDFEWNLTTDTTRWSPALAALYGLPPQGFESSCQAWLERIHPDDRKATAERAYGALQSGRFDAEWRVIWPNGTVRWLAGRAVVYKDAAGTPWRMLGVNIDITEQKEAQETVRRVSRHDPLTGLPSRALLYEFADLLLARARRGGHCAAFLFADLDRFKPINDTYGHCVGDAVLQEVARRLSACVRGEDLVGRLGGDEFLAVLSTVSSEEDAAKVALNMLGSLGEPFRVGALELQVSPSIGISLFPKDGVAVDALIKNADIAMYQAKEGGRNTYQFFRLELNARSDEALKIESRLRQGLEDGEFVLFFQPVVDLDSGELVAAEALIRWPAMQVEPDRFIPVAETAGFMQTLGAWVLREACRHKRQWMERGLPSFPVAVNVSPTQFREASFARSVSEAIADSGVAPQDLRLELTESTVMKNLDAAAAVLRAVRHLGVTVALDDFGTGYSSLSYLSQLPLDILKLDQSFVRRVAGRQRDRGCIAIVDAIIAMAKSLRLDVVAEGIESEQAISFLRRRRCRHGQGFHLCRPLPASEFARWCLAHAA